MPFCRWPRWPVTRKCCFFIPIRKGVTIFAYANLVFNLLSLPILIFLPVDHIVSERHPTEGDTRDPISMHATNIAFMCTDVVLIIILLVGAHKRNKRLLQLYFYLGVGFQVITLCLDIIISISFEYVHLEEDLIYLFFLSLNIYQLFLVYNIIHILEESKEVQYVVYQ